MIRAKVESNLSQSVKMVPLCKPTLVLHRSGNVFAVENAEVADACGFADQSHLTRTFRRATGDTPGAWRRERTIAGHLSHME
jgi:AraC-like DNA-binding protein